jgi:hypothetical protein
MEYGLYWIPRGILEIASATEHIPRVLKAIHILILQSNTSL